MKSVYPTKLIGDVLSLEYGKPLPEQDRTTDPGIPAYGANGVLCWSRKAFRNAASIIVGRKGSAGEVNLTDGPFWPTDVTYFVDHESKATDLKFLFYVLKFLDLPRLAKGVKPGINRNEVYALEVPIPSIEEQRRIVALLDEAFDGIAKAAVNAEKNLGNARELFRTCLDQSFASQGSDWVSGQLSETLQEQPRNGWSPPAAHHAAIGTPVLTLSSVTGFNFRPEKVKFTSAPTDRNRPYWVENGDLLLTRSNTPLLVGHVAVAERVAAPTIYPDLIMRMRADQKVARTRFLYYQLRSTPLREEIKKRARGANPTMVKLSGGDVRSLPIRLPPVAEQDAIISRLVTMSANTDALESTYNAKAAALDKLKQALLEKAFSGQLTSADAA